MPNIISRRRISAQTSSGCTPGVDPQNHQIVEEIGAFPHHRFGAAVHGVDDDLDRLFRQLLGHFRAPGLEQLGRPRFRGVAALGGDDGVIEPGDQISHARYNILFACQSG